MPSHRDMQMALVEVGDKDKPFVGSREWIGSFEVSTVLNQLLGVKQSIDKVSMLYNLCVCVCVCVCVCLSVCLSVYLSV